ncbi:hypothetical protein D3C71_2078870 [compost metagenome]
MFLTFRGLGEPQQVQDGVLTSQQLSGGLVVEEPCSPPALDLDLDLYLIATDTAEANLLSL